MRALSFEVTVHPPVIGTRNPQALRHSGDQLQRAPAPTANTDTVHEPQGTQDFYDRGPVGCCSR
jgi:hypothetical protein